MYWGKDKGSLIRTFVREWGPVKGLCLGIANGIDSLLGRLAAALGLLGQKDGLDVGQDTSLGNGDS